LPADHDGVNDTFTQERFIHLILMDEAITPQGWHVWCIPHGPLGAYRSAPEAFLAGLEHDVLHGGGSCR
jgi:hypothetical protein